VRILGWVRIIELISWDVIILSAFSERLWVGPDRILDALGITIHPLDVGDAMLPVFLSKFDAFHLQSIQKFFVQIVLQEIIIRRIQRVHSHMIHEPVLGLLVKHRIANPTLHVSHIPSPFFAIS
jgi:hypothetical protein